MRLGLSVYGTMFSMGMLESSGCPQIRPMELIDKALAFGLVGVEIPVELLENEDAMAVGRYAQERDMFISLETVGFDPVHLTSALELAARMGVPTLRTIVMGAKFGGDRRHWKLGTFECSLTITGMNTRLALQRSFLNLCVT